MDCTINWTILQQISKRSIDAVCVQLQGQYSSSGWMYHSHLEQTRPQVHIHITNNLWSLSVIVIISSSKRIIQLHMIVGILKGASVSLLLHTVTGWYWKRKKTASLKNCITKHVCTSLGRWLVSTKSIITTSIGFQSLSSCKKQN